MKYGVIDIGSNSVRLMINENGKTLYKLVKITKLAEGMGDEKILKAQSVDRTVSAVSFFVEKAFVEKVDCLYVFATAAVRSAKNSLEFINILKNRVGVNVDVVSGENEAKLGVLGALDGVDGAIIDIGGASTEICVVKNRKTVFAKSIDIGVVKIKDVCGQDKFKAQIYIKNKLAEFGNVPASTFYGIGGTATSLASVQLKLEPYDPNIIDGYCINFNELDKTVEYLYSLSIEEKRRLKGLQKERAEVVAGGSLLLLELMKMLNIDKIFVSEKDNLEGYLIFKEGKYE